MWKLYRKFATKKLSLWQPAKEPLDSSHVQDLTIVEQVTFLVDDHYHTTGIESHLTSHHTMPLSAQMQNSTLQTRSPSGGWLDFYSSSTTPMRQSSSSQEQTDSNMQTPVTPLWTQSKAGSFLRDRIFAKQHSHLTSNEGRGRKGLVTNILKYLPTPSSDTQQKQLN